MQEKRRGVLLVNAVASVIYVLLLIAHCYLQSRRVEWTHQFDMYWPNIDSLVVCPLLYFFAGYTLFGALFLALKAKLEIVSSGRRNLLRAVMLVITAVAVAMLLILTLEMSEINVISWAVPKFWIWAMNVCRGEWFWLGLGIYWFLSINAIHMTEFEAQAAGFVEDDDDDFDDEDFNEDNDFDNDLDNDL